MSELLPDNTGAFANFSLDQIVLAPLAGHSIGPAGSQFVIAEWRDPGSPPGPPRLIAPVHVHHNDDEAWYVLEGMLAFRLGDHEVEASAGTAVFAPHGVPHTYWNPRPTLARYLLIMPSNIRSLIDDLHASTDRDPAAVRAIYRRHDSDLLP